MINKHYQDLSDDNLVTIHNQLFPERTMYLNHKSITKKTLNYYVHYYVPFQKVIYYVIN